MSFCSRFQTVSRISKRVEEMVRLLIIKSLVDMPHMLGLGRRSKSATEVTTPASCSI